MNPEAPTGDHTDQPQRRSNRRFATLGVAAGLLGGGAIGLVATMPSITSAATDDPAAALQDEGTDDGTEDATDESTVDRSAKIREALQPLVDDGTLSADQADAVATYLDENAPERHGRRGGGFHGLPGRDGEVVAGIIGIDVETLREELSSGSSIADVAEANGVEVQAVIDALVAEAQAHLDLTVESGRLTEEEAAEKAENIEERITARVNGERPERGERFGRG